MKVVALIPIKLNNERMPGKNLKSFENGRPLLSYILETALKVDSIDELYVYCSSETIVDYLPAKVRFLKRPAWLDLSSTSMTDVITSFIEAVEADIYVLLHATAPFISAKSIEDGINALKEKGHDSAIAVRRHYEFLWRDGKPDNYDVFNIPRTQDLEPYFTETTGMYVFAKELAKRGLRIGLHPHLIEVCEIEAVDINEPIDFKIANAIYNYILSSGR